MSWQNIVLSRLLRAFVKPRSLATELDVAGLRRRLGSFPFGRQASEGFLIDDTIPGPVPGECIVRAGIVTPRTVLYLHGGGYVVCGPHTHRPITQALAREAEARVIVPDYRLAPEHPFPAALDDAIQVYRQLLDTGIAPERIAVAGDSAGGGLALVLLVRLRDEGLPLPAGAWLMSPWVDLAGSGDTMQSNDAADAMFHGAGVHRLAKLYLEDTPATHPWASPLYADLAGLPPIFVQVSDTEVLLDDARRVVARVQEAGGQAELAVWAGLPHVWQVFSAFVPEGRRALREGCDFLRRVMP